jgi:hypothetical protein
MRHALIFVALVLAVLSAGCKRAQDENAPPKTTKTKFSQERLKAPLGADGIRKAWDTQTRLHAVFIGLYDRKDAAGQKAMQDQLDRVYFVANPYLTADFDTALKEQPTEPANYVSYGYYLLPRRDQYETGLKNIEQGITMEPENPAWQFLLANAYICPFRSGDFTRFSVLDRERWKRYQDKYDIVIARAAKLWPDNWYIPYFAAQHQFILDQDFKKVMEWIEQGNKAESGQFIFVPPLPLTIDNWNAVPDRDSYFDLQWNYGFYAYNTMGDIVTGSLRDKDIASNPDKLWELLSFFYRASCTKPYDRVYHQYMGRIIRAIGDCYSQKGDSAKAAKVAEALKFYESVTKTFAVYFADSGLKKVAPDDPTDDSLLIIEASCRRQTQVIEPVMKLELRLVKQVREAMGYSASDRPLPNLDGGKE